jgi:transposase-like protein
MPTACGAGLLDPGDQWHLDEVFLRINGRLHYLRRAVDQDGDVLDILVQSRRDKKAAKKFFRKLLKGSRYVPRVIITDKLRSYSAAKAEVLPSIEHCQDKWQNNRAENSHQPTRLRERVMRRFHQTLPLWFIVTRIQAAIQSVGASRLVGNRCCTSAECAELTTRLHLPLNQTIPSTLRQHR